MSFDLTTFSEGITALNTAVDRVRSACSMIKDFRSTGRTTEQEQKAIENAVTVASTSTALAEAKLGQTFCYELCKCTFPPTPMVTVGYLDRNCADNKRIGDVVYECQKCGYDTAAPFDYTRTAPERQAQTASTSTSTGPEDTATSLDPTQVQQMAQSLAEVRGTLEQLAAGQDLMACAIARLEVRRRGTAFKGPRASATAPAAPARKPTPVPPPSGFVKTATGFRI
jgi:hypothetical protein